MSLSVNWNVQSTHYRMALSNDEPEEDRVAGI